MNFVDILLIATIITGIIIIIDKLFLAKARATSENPSKLPILVDYSKSFFPVLLIVFILRSFLFEPYRIPSGSMKPSLEVGDFIIVNKYAYGLRMPILNKKIISIGEPNRGDILVFYNPKKNLNMIKRVVGLPGDHINYKNNVLYINGKAISQEFKRQKKLANNLGSRKIVLYQIEHIPEHSHAVYVEPISNFKRSYLYNDLLVPKDSYFVLGDNRPGSEDSRYWGFVADKHIIGKAFAIWASWDADNFKLRWHRMFKSIDDFSKNKI